MSQVQDNESSNNRRPKLNNLRSVTFDEAREDSSAQSFNNSDGGKLRDWQYTRSEYAPKSVPNRTHYKSSLQECKGSSYAPPVFLAPGELERSSVPECGVCYEEFNDEGLKVPRCLTCGHSYCTGCINVLLKKTSQSFISCPKCNQPTDVKNNDVSNLPKNFSLMDVVRDSLVSSSEHLSSSEALARPRSASPGHEPNPTFKRCDEHNGDNLSHFCKVCSKLVCSSCLLYGKHREHNSKTMFVNEAASLYRKKVNDFMPEVRKQRGRMELALGKVERMNASVQQKGGELIDEAEDVYGQLIALIEARRDAFKMEIMERTQIRVEALSDQARDLRECIEKAEGVQVSTSQLLKMDDYSMLENVKLTMDMIEGVFVNPPQCTPRAQDDLICEFPDSPKDEIASNLSAYGKVRPDVGMISNLYIKPYHDGFSIQWDGHNYIDNEGTTYYLQKAEGEDTEFRPLYRGSATKFLYKDDLKQGEKYRFRVQVRTMEGVGHWTAPTEVLKVAPDFRWHESWRNVKVDLCRHKMEAGWTKGGSHNFWASFAGDKLLTRGRQHYCEIEILEISKSKSLKKLGIGVISSKKSKTPTMPWQDGKDPVGQFDTPSWGFQPLLGMVYSQSTSSEGRRYCSESTLQQNDKIGILVDLDEGTISYFINGTDLGVAFENIDEEAVLLCVSLRDKMRVLLRFPPPPYHKRKVRLTKLTSMGEYPHF